jgi:hypothetical protein
VSWGEDCGDPDFPAVNARVSQVSDWIDEVVCELSDNPPADFCARNNWHWPAMTGGPSTMLCFVIMMAAVGFVLLRKKRSHKATLKVSLEEQESLCDSLSSSSEDYQAVEFT